MKTLLIIVGTAAVGVALWRLVEPSRYAAEVCWGEG